MRIVHVLGLIAGCALGFATYRSLTPPLNTEFQTFSQIYNCGMGIAFGLILTGNITLAHQRWRSDVMARPVLPGHWLLALAMAATLAVGGAIGAYHGLHFTEDPSEPIGPPYWVQVTLRAAAEFPGVFHQFVGWGLGSLITLGFCVASFRKLGWHWWGWFLVSALGTALLFEAYAGVVTNTSLRHFFTRCNRAQNLYGKVVTASLLMLIFAITYDTLHGRRGDRSHWVGVLSWLIILTLQLVLYCRYTFGALPFSQSWWSSFTL